MTGTPPSLSVVVPVHRGAATLRDTLDSLARQTVPLAEVVVVDDGSPDLSAQIAQHHPCRPTVIRLPTNQGVGHARNVGAFHASSEFIAFLDQDDLWLPTRAARLITVLADHPDWDALVTGAEVFAVTEDRAALADHPFRDWVQHWAPAAAVVDLLDAVPAGPPPTGGTPVALPHLLSWTVTKTTSYVLRRSAFHAAGGCATWLRSADDWLLLQALARHTTVHAVADDSMLYRVHRSNTSIATDWGLPLLLAAAATRHGGLVVPTGSARRRDVVGPLSDSGFLMNLLVTLARHGQGPSVRDTLSVVNLLAVDAADRRAILRRVGRAQVARWAAGLRATRPGAGLSPRE